jgi:hypothetical protein
MAVKERSSTFRALGNDEPPKTVLADGKTYQLVEIYKHDSWAATAYYKAVDGAKEQDGIVCKFNRFAPIGPIPMAWLGNILAEREMWFYNKLHDVDYVTSAVIVKTEDGKDLPHVSAHPYIEGGPFMKNTQASDEYFDQLLDLIKQLHANDIAYVDMNKRENMIIDLDGRPNLMDFQISFAPERFSWATRWLANLILPTLKKSDIYHVNKHYVRTRPDLLTAEQLAIMSEPPKFIKLHRKIGVPIRTFRRAILVKLGFRNKDGLARSEANPEVAFRDDKDGGA